MSTIEPQVIGRKTPSTAMAVATSVDPEELLDANETAKLLRQRPQTLAGWRCDGVGPEYLKVGRAVFYRRSAISTWLASRIIQPTAA